MKQSHFAYNNYWTESYLAKFAANCTYQVIIPFNDCYQLRLFVFWQGHTLVGIFSLYKTYFTTRAVSRFISGRLPVVDKSINPRFTNII